MDTRSNSLPAVHPEDELKLYSSEPQCPSQRDMKLENDIRSTIDSFTSEETSYFYSEGDEDCKNRVKIESQCSLAELVGEEISVKDLLGCPPSARKGLNSDVNDDTLVITFFESEDPEDWVKNIVGVFYRKKERTFVAHMNKRRQQFAGSKYGMKEAFLQACKARKYFIDTMSEYMEGENSRVRMSKFTSRPAPDMENSHLSMPTESSYPPPNQSAYNYIYHAVKVMMNTMNDPEDMECTMTPKKSLTANCSPTRSLRSPVRSPSYMSPPRNIVDQTRMQCLFARERYPLGGNLLQNAGGQFHKRSSTSLEEYYKMRKRSNI